jgi:hypothetical protein
MYVLTARRTDGAQLGEHASRLISAYLRLSEPAQHAVVALLEAVCPDAVEANYASNAASGAGAGSHRPEAPTPLVD